jgi:hypothetical protein
MFEQELEMEKKVSSIVPLLLIVTLIIAIVGVSLYFVAQSRRVLATTEAAPAVLASLETQGPVMLHFQTGVIKSSVNEKIRDPHYRLLEKAGYIRVGKETKGKTPVSLTPEGTAFLNDITGVKKSSGKDGNDEYAVPLAQRRLLEIGRITMVNPAKATVEYSWKWETTKAGELFDAAGPMVKGFNTWDRSTLISKYGANFYHGAPTRVAVSVVKNEKGWQIGSEY